MTVFMDAKKQSMEVQSLTRGKKLVKACYEGAGPGGMVILSQQWPETGVLQHTGHTLQASLQLLRCWQAVMLYGPVNHL